MRNASIMLAASLVGIHGADLAASQRGREEPDPVHSRAIKREVRKQQREQAKRTAKLRKGA